MCNCNGFVTGRLASAAGTLIFAYAVLAGVNANAQAPIIGTVAGGEPTGSLATAYGAKGVSSVALDASGNLYVAVALLNQVWVVSPSGALTEIIGSGPQGESMWSQVFLNQFNYGGSFSGDGGPATRATLNGPSGVALDASGNLYIADTGNNVIRKVTGATGIITTVAGTGGESFGGDNGPAVKAQLNSPWGVATDAAGNLYIADSGNNAIREVSAQTGVIETVAGNPALPPHSYSGDGGPATAAGLNFPTSLVVSSNGDLYIADNYNRVVRKVTSATGVIGTFAGNGGLYFSGAGKPATQASIGFPQAVTLDVFGNLYIGANWNVLEVSSSTGVIASVAGTGQPGYSGDGGPAGAAQLESAFGVAFDPSGNLYIADYGGNAVRKIAARSGVIATVAGNNLRAYNGDGEQATRAQLNQPFAVVADGAGDLYIADTSNGLVRKVDARSGTIATVAGSIATPFEAPGSGDGQPAAGIPLGAPGALALDAGNNLYIVDVMASDVRKVSAATGIIATVAGTGYGGLYTGEGGPATQAHLPSPRGVAVDSSGNVYIADAGAIRKVDTNGIITTLGGVGFIYALLSPRGLALDGSGNLYIADPGLNDVLRLSLSSGAESLIAGAPGPATGYSGDNGPATRARLNQPSGVAVASNGDVYIADTGNNVIRKVSAATGIITTVAGTGAYAFGGDQGPAIAARLANPTGIGLGPGDRLYIADTNNNRIRAVPGPVVAPLPAVSPSFKAGSSVAAGATTTLSFVVTNPATEQAASAVGFRSALSAGLAVASPNGLSGSCGNVSAPEGGQTVEVSGATLSAGGTCSFSIEVAAAGIGAQYSTVADLVSGGQAANFFSLAGITVNGTAGAANAASFAAGPIAPNAIFSYFGPVACLPNEQVLVNGIEATILFGNSGQINFVSPGSLAGSSSVVQVVCNGNAVVSVDVPAGAVGPALFTQTGTGTGAGSVVNSNGTVNSAANPARAGDYISVYGTGFGALNAPGSDGLRRLAANVTATIGGVDAPVIYAGEAPTETIGLQQINIQVPVGSTSGTAAALVLTANGMPTQGGVTVEIQ